MGNAYRHLEDQTQAIACQQHSLAVAQEIADRRGEMAALNNLGLAFKALGDHETAIQYEAQSLIIARELAR